MRRISTLPCRPGFGTIQPTMAGPPLNRRDFVRLCGAGLTLPLLTGFSAPLSGRLSAARSQAIELTASGQVPSLSVAVLHRGHPIWVEAFGWADRERGVLARTSTPYAIASASKPFTGMAVAQLVASGRIALDDPIERYLPSVSNNGVTFRETLQHRSGIPRHWRNFFAPQGRPPPFPVVAGDHAFTTNARGRRYLYSNMNYGLLAAAVEAVTGKPFHDYLREAVFRPLELTTAGSLDDHWSEWRAAVPYEADRSSISPYLSDEMGARDLLMSAFDMAQFGLAHLDGRAGPATALMLENRSPINTTGIARSSYGLGWIVEEDSPAALFSYGHTGEGPGASASLTIVPADQIVVATMANAQGPAAYVLNEAIVDSMSLDFAARRSAHPYQEQPPDDAALGSLEGRWTGQLETSGGVHRAEATITTGPGSQIMVGEQQAELTHVVVRNGVLNARADLRVPAPDAQRSPHQSRLTLDAIAGRLDGTLAAYARRGPIPHDQFWLSYRLILNRS